MQIKYIQLQTETHNATKYTQVWTTLAKPFCSDLFITLIHTFSTDENKNEKHINALVL